MNNPQLCVGAQIAIVACSQSRNESLHELGSGKLFVGRSQTQKYSKKETFMI